MAAWLEEERKNGLEILLVMESAERVEDVEKWVKEKRIAFPVLHDPKGANSKAWDAGAIASAFLLDADGKIAWNGRIGPQGDADGCEAAIRAQLKARAGTLEAMKR